MNISVTTTYTYETFKEFSDNYRRTLRIVLLVMDAFVIAVGCFLLGVYAYQFLALQVSPDLSRVLMALLFVVAGIYLFINKTVMRNKTLRKNPSIGMVSTCRFTEDGIEVSTVAAQGQGEGTYSYAVMASAFETEHYICLVNQSRQVQMLAKDGFTEGSLEDLKTLLHAKIDPKKLKLKA